MVHAFIDAMPMPPGQLPRCVLFAAGAAGASAAFAHAPADAAAGTWADACIIAGFLIAAGLYALGLWRLWRRAHRGAGVPVRRAGCYAAGLALLGLVLAPPLDTLGAELFSAHMLQHEAMMLGAAPLLVAGRPLPVFLWAFPEGARHRLGAAVGVEPVRQAWRLLSRPLCAWSLHGAVLWAWHFPRLFQAGLESEAAHVLQHASFLASALLFWASLSGPAARQGAAVLSLLTTAIHTGILGALLTFSPHAWYPAYTGTTMAWGLTVLEDQQLGGLIMWVPAGFLFVFAGLVAAAKAIGPDRERTA